MEEEVSEFKSAGVDDILIKPIDAQMLFTVLGLTDEWLSGWLIERWIDWLIDLLIY